MGRFALALVATGLMAAAPARAAIIDFDDLASTDDPIANGYAGLGWDNLFVADPSVAPVSGFQPGLVSGTKVAYNGYEAAATISGLGKLVLDSGYFTAVGNDGLTITALGYDGNALVRQASFTVDTRRPTRHSFAWSGITNVVFSSAGGTDQFFDISSAGFVLDQLSVSAAVPEPGTWGTMLLGLAMVGGAVRLRRRGRTVAIG